MHGDVTATSLAKVPNIVLTGNLWQFLTEWEITFIDLLDDACLSND